MRQGWRWLRRATGRTTALAAAMAACGAALLGLGCVALNGEDVLLPESLASGGAGAQRLDASTRRLAFARDFPALPAIRVSSGVMRLGGAGLAGQSMIDFFYYARDGRQWRLLARRGDRPLLDLAERDGFMTVINYRTGGLIQCPSPGGGPGFARYLKWDPATLYWALSICQTMGQTELVPATADGQDGALRPERAAAAGGLAWARLDPETGLPSDAQWTQNGRSWRAKYIQWGSYPRTAGDAGAADARQAMPARVTLTDEATGAVIDVQARAYGFGVPGKTADPFTPVLSWPPRRQPASELEKALQ